MNATWRMMIVFVIFSWFVWTIRGQLELMIVWWWWERWWWRPVNVGVDRMLGLISADVTMMIMMTVYWSGTWWNMKLVSRDITETIININHTFRFTLASKVDYWGSNMSIFTCKYSCGSGCEVLHIFSYCCVWHSNNCRDTNEGSVRHRLRSRGPDQSPGSPLILPADPERFVHPGWCRMSGGNCWDQSRKLTCSNRFIISRKSFR